MSFGIHAVGAYAPRRRIPAEAFEDAWGRFEPPGIETTAVPAADEDALTMGWEAANRALNAVKLDSSAIDHLSFATTTPPLEEEDLTARLGSLLGISTDATRHVYTGSTRAGTRALDTTLDAGPERGLVVVADCPRGDPYASYEHAAGAGASAFLVGPEAPVRIADRAEHTEAYPGTRFRELGDTRVTGINAGTYDQRAFSRPLESAVRGLEVSDIDAVAIQMPDGKQPYRAANRIGLDAATVQAAETVSTLGDTGAASVPLGISTALANGADCVLAAAWGSGAGADAFVLVREDEVPTAIALDGEERVEYPTYLRLRGEITAEEPDGGGAYVSLPSWHRSLPQRHRLVAGRCPECDAYTFPPEGACDACDTLVEFERIELPGTGTVETRTRIGQGGAPPEFAELQSRGGGFGVAIVAFDTPGDDVASVPAMVVDDVAVGDRVRATRRRIYTQEGVTRYGFKLRAAE